MITTRTGDWAAPHACPGEEPAHAGDCTASSGERMLTPLSSTSSRPTPRMARLLDRIESPRDLEAIPVGELPRVCAEIRGEIIATCARTGGRLGSSLDAVELIVALHHVFDSPRDRRAGGVPARDAPVRVWVSA